MASFWQTWLWGYTRPRRFAEELAVAPAPQWGLYGQALRAGMDALLLYLPRALTGHETSVPSYITFLPTKTYLGWLVGLSPLVLFLQWLLCSAVVHLALRLSRRRSDMDIILNVGGMTALVVGAFIVVWDWAWITLRVGSGISLGMSHLVIDLWAVLLMILALRESLNVPVWLGIMLNVLWIAAGVPLGVLFMRPPL